MPDPEQPAAAPGSWERPVGMALVLLLTVLLCVWAAFLVPLRIGTVRLPVSLVLAFAGNVLLGRAGSRLYGLPGVLVPALLWTVLGVLLGSKRTEGDLVVPGDLVGTLFLAVGVLGFAVAYGTSSARAAAATPAGDRRR